MNGDSSGEGERLKGILKMLEGCMIGGRIAPGKANTFSRQSSFTFGDDGPRDNAKSNGGANVAAASRLPPSLGGRQESFGLSGLAIGDEGDEGLRDPREWLKVIGGFEQPQLIYNTGRKHFERYVYAVPQLLGLLRLIKLLRRSSFKPSFFPPPTQKTELFRQRYHITHQRLLRNEAFQIPSLASTGSSSFQRTNSITASQTSKITPIANLLGRSGSNHVLLGLLALSPTSTLVLSDLTGTIGLDLQHARPVPEEGSWFCPGMVVLVDGVYDGETDNAALSGGLGSSGGVGGTLNGKFVVHTMGHPPCERRSITTGAVLEPGTSASISAAAPFGWTDFLGVGSERASGSRMRKLQARLLRPVMPPPGGEGDMSRGRIAIAAEVAANVPSTLPALRVMLQSYASGSPENFPLAIVLTGNFLSIPPMTGVPGASSIDYKEAFDALASVLAEFPSLLARTTLMLVPGDNDGWAGAGSAGAATLLPHKPVPDMFTTRIRRVQAEANRAVGSRPADASKEGDFSCTSNPARLSVFGCAGEIVFFRDDTCGRLRRGAVNFTPKHADDEEEEEVEITESTADNRRKNRRRYESISRPMSPTLVEPMDVDASIQAERQQSHGMASPRPPQPDPDTVLARRLVHTILSQSHLSPFPLYRRPVHWAFGSSLSLYPLPSVLVLADAEAPPFSLVYCGCTVINPGPIVAGKGRAGWAEVDVGIGNGMRGKICGADF